MTQKQTGRNRSPVAINSVLTQCHLICDPTGELTLKIGVLNLSSQIRSTKMDDWFANWITNQFHSSSQLYFFYNLHRLWNVKCVWWTFAEYISHKYLQYGIELRQISCILNKLYITFLQLNLFWYTWSIVLASLFDHWYTCSCISSLEATTVWYLANWNLETYIVTLDY